jgi:hypothetical protein
MRNGMAWIIAHTQHGKGATRSARHIILQY